MSKCSRCSRSSPPAHANDTTCGDDPDKVPNCDKPDHGSCGNARAASSATWYSATAQAVYNQTVAFLKAGGYDGSFAYVTGRTRPATTLRLSRRRGTRPWWYIFQGSHSTTGGYIDTLNFFLKANAAGDISTLRVGSISPSTAPSATTARTTRRSPCC